MKLSNLRAHEIADGLMNDIDVIATRDDLYHVMDGIRFLGIGGADDYAFVVQLKLDARLAAQRTVFRGFDRAGHAVFDEVRGFTF